MNRERKNKRTPCRECDNEETGGWLRHKRRDGAMSQFLSCHMLNGSML